MNNKNIISNEDMVEFIKKINYETLLAIEDEKLFVICNALSNFLISSDNIENYPKVKLNEFEEETVRVMIAGNLLVLCRLILSSKNLDQVLGFLDIIKKDYYKDLSKDEEYNKNLKESFINILSESRLLRDKNNKGSEN